ncbi:zinc-ribbon domain-containing protein [Candidatus Bathyarchaeota archaeon]|nr:MAG: zinc-ribbon domain-containing protein [Candidatus Bathyarchaeota archaeon]
MIKEVVKVKCKYCGALIDSTVQACPFCGAPRT